MHNLTLILYLIIALVILLAIKYFYCEEGFTEVSNLNKTFEDVIKGVNFKLTTTISGTKYYLVISNLGNCTKHMGHHKCNPTHDNKEHEFDCSRNSLILVSEADYKKMLEEENLNNQKEKVSCEAKHKIDCEYELKKKIKEEVQQELKCELPKDKCEIPQYDPALFILQTTIEGKNKLIGYVREDKKLIPKAVNINKNVNNYKTVCIDADNDLKLEDIHGFESVVFEKTTDEKLSYLIKFTIPNYIDCQDKLTGKYFVNKAVGNKLNYNYYFGISEQDNKQKYILSCDNNPRITVYREDDKKPHLWLKFNIE